MATLEARVDVLEERVCDLLVTLQSVVKLVTTHREALERFAPMIEDIRDAVRDVAEAIDERPTG